MKEKEFLCVGVASLLMHLLKLRDHFCFEARVYRCTIHVVQFAFVREINVSKGFQNQLHTWLKLSGNEGRLVVHRNVGIVVHALIPTE